jgi:hypothetical protein
MQKLTVALLVRSPEFDSWSGDLLLSEFSSFSVLTRKYCKIGHGHFPHVPFYYLLPPYSDRLCGLVVRVLGYRSGGPGSIPGTTRKKKQELVLERGPLSLVSTTEELLDRKVAAPV